MTQTELSLEQLPNDIGGLPSERIQQTDHILEPWEKRCHALADVLDYYKVLSTEEKRRGVESLGADLIGKADLLRALDCSLCKHPLPETGSDP
jgi:hypothetical protein